MRRSLLMLAIACTAALSASAALAAERVLVRLLPANELFCLEFEGSTLRVARTEEGLAGMKPLQAIGGPGGWDEPGGVRATSYRFPEIPVPVKRARLPGVHEAAVTFGITRFTAAAEGSEPPTAPWINGQFRISMRDSAGAEWSYLTYSSVREDEPGVRPAPPCNFIMPVYSSLETLTPKVEAKVTRRQVAIGIRMWAADPDDRESARRVGFVPLLNNLRRNGKPAPARIEVHDAAGKVVTAKDGNLETFGFG